MILRPGVVYGPGDRAVFPLFKRRQRGVFPLVGRTDAAYTFIYVDDVVRAMVAALEGTAAADVFVGHPQPVTPRGPPRSDSARVGATAAVIRFRCR